MKLFFFQCLFIPLLGWGSISIKETLQQGKKGDYLVVQYDSFYSMLIYQKQEKQLITIEEICVPKASIKSKHFDWKKWLLQGAPHQSSWLIYRIDLQKQEMHDCFSVVQNAFLSTENLESFIVDVLKLPFKEVPNTDRKRIGVTPEFGEIDTRKLWLPKVYHEGKKIKKPHFLVYHTTWPKDGSLLANKTLECYFLEEPFPFPYWIHITDASEAAYHIRGMEFGSGAISPKLAPFL